MSIGLEDFYKISNLEKRVAVLEKLRSAVEAFANNDGTPGYSECERIVTALNECDASLEKLGG